MTHRQVGPELPEPLILAWDPSMQFCAMAYTSQVLLCRVAPSFHVAAAIPIAHATCLEWSLRQLYIATPTAIYCALVAAAGAPPPPPPAMPVGCPLGPPVFTIKPHRDVCPVSLVHLLPSLHTISWMLPPSVLGTRSTHASSHGQAVAVCTLYYTI